MAADRRIFMASPTPVPAPLMSTGKGTISYPTVGGAGQVPEGGRGAGGENAVLAEQLLAIQGLYSYDNTVAAMPHSQYNGSKGVVFKSPVLAPSAPAGSRTFIG